MVFKAFLIKYAEIGVKGKNRGIFEDALVRQIRYALKRCEGQFAVHRTRGRIYVDVLSEEYDYDETVEHLKNGEMVELLAISGSWYKIKNDGLTGYVSKSKVKPIK